MSEITISRLGPETKDLLARVAPGTFDHPVRAEYLEAFLASPDHVMLLALDGDLVVGMASAVFHYHPDKPRQMFINEVAVSPDWQRRGIATRLMRGLLRIAEREGARTVWLATETENAPARGLYRSLAAREVEGIVMYEWGDEA